jgi:hypothetical protein
MRFYFACALLLSACDPQQAAAVPDATPDAVDIDATPIPVDPKVTYSFPPSGPVPAECAGVPETLDGLPAMGSPDRCPQLELRVNCAHRRALPALAVCEDADDCIGVGGYALPSCNGGNSWKGCGDTGVNRDEWLASTVKPLLEAAYQSNCFRTNSQDCGQNYLAAPTPCEAGLCMGAADKLGAGGCGP